MESTKPMRIVVLGTRRSGKTSIVKRFVSGGFDSEENSSVSSAQHQKLLILEEGQKDYILDPESSENGQVTFKEQLIKADAIMIIYDATSQKSFKEVAQIVEQTAKNCGEKTVAVLIANKIDLMEQRLITQEEGEFLAEKVGKYYQVSAKQHYGIDEIFLFAITAVEEEYPGLVHFFNKSEIPAPPLPKEETYPNYSGAQSHFNGIIKINLLGDLGVGKTQLASAYCNSSFLEQYIPTLGVDFQIRKVDIPEQMKKNSPLQTIIVQLWDLSGSSKYKQIRQIYYNNLKVAFLVYDCTKSQTFQNLNLLIQEIKQTGKVPKVVLLGNKNDVEQSLKQVSTEEGQQFAADHGYQFAEVSAKTGQNVQKVFNKYVFQSFLNS